MLVTVSLADHTSVRPDSADAKLYVKFQPEEVQGV